MSVLYAQVIVDIVHENVAHTFTYRIPDGMTLTPEAREALRERTHAQVFFSKELCAKYFTYMDEETRGHFVLFDDESTLEEKAMLLTRLGVHRLFALWPDVRHIL